MLEPKKVKHRKAFKGRISGVADSGSRLSFANFGLKALEPFRITAQQIEAARKTINRYLRRSGKLFIRIFPNVPVTAKPLEVRMGSSKGSLDRWVCRVKPGRMLFELGGVTKDQAIGAFKLAAAKLPIKTKTVIRIEAPSISDE